MIKVTRNFNSNMDDFERKLLADIEKAKKDMGRIGVNSIKAASPVKTGLLKGSNKYTIDEDLLIYYNNVEYAEDVEFGLERQRANPFMRRGINNAKSGFDQLIKMSLGV